MAVTDNSNRGSKSPVKEGVEQQCGKEADTGTHTRRKDVERGNFGTIKRHKIRQSDTKEKDSDSLSDIDDAQIIGYFNNKVEMQYKKILWEALNRQHTDATKRKRKRTMETKKRVPVKKVKTDEKVEVRKLSSKINYDALKDLEEFGEDSEVALNIGANSSSYQAEDEHDTGYRNNGSLGDYTDDGWYEF